MAGSGKPSTSGSADGPAHDGAGQTTSYRVLIQFSSTPAAIDAQVDELRRLVTADSFELVAGPAEADVWHDQTRGAWGSTGSIVRASWLPASLPAVLSLLTEMAGPGGQTMQLAARAGVGAGLIRIDGHTSAHAAAIERLRSRPGVLGHVVVLRADPSVTQQVDVWGAPSDHEALLGAVKRAFDPAGILNAGRGPV